MSEHCLERLHANKTAITTAFFNECEHVLKSNSPPATSVKNLGDAAWSDKPFNDRSMYVYIYMFAFRGVQPS